MISIVNKQKSPIYLIEIQGKIQLLSTDLTIGELGFNSKEPFLTIGNHIISGHSVSLKKPILVLEKHKLKDQRVLHCKRIIREKLVFQSRPEHIIDQSLL
jgi:hypothetical protein